jgi:hypothetical protein
VEPKVANRLRRGNVIEEDRRAGPTTELEGHVGTLGSIHLDTPSPTLALDTREIVLKDLKGGVRIRVPGEDTSAVSKRGQEGVRMGWHVGSIYIV